MIADTMNRSVRRPGMTRRTLLGRSTVLMATSGLMLGLGAAAPLLAKKNKKKKDKETEDEKKGAKTIVRKFSSDNAVVIDDNTTANPYPSTIQVSGIKKGKVIDVNVILRGLNHGFPDNIDAVLVAPGGASTVLMSDVGGGTDALSVTLTLDDEASASLPDATALENGAFKPANFGAGADTYPQLGVAPTEANLSQLDGGNPNGEWRLFVLDDANGSTGAYSGGWDLELTIKLEKKKKKNKKKKDAKLDEK